MINQFYKGSKKKKEKACAEQEGAALSKLQREANATKDYSVPDMTFVQLEGYCFCYGKQGHKSPDCQMLDKIYKKDVAINKNVGKAFNQQMSQDAPSSVATTTTTGTTGTTQPTATPIAMDSTTIQQAMPNTVTFQN